ncbi:ABC transporter permease subunit [Microvirga rosea]|uniref:ABC transporter permease subunit n=1 Tax=Microvirga rosea TaxID=2715425 RepID=UPI001D0A1D9B|nr:ABC transporter permease subunit [Microvirga rosea]MCB8821990.1 ABC transporter permease subunit [Microvirga rosea]
MRAFTLLEGPGDPRVARLGGSVLLAGATIALIVLIVGVIGDALAARGIRSGFGFLFQPSGFQIAESLFPVGPDDPYLAVILAGLANTALVAALSIPFATVLGAIVALIRSFAPRPIRAVASSYIELFRNTPVLLQFFVWYGLLLKLPSAREAFEPLPGIILSNRGLAVPGVVGGAAWLVLAIVGIVLFVALGRKRRTLAWLFLLGATLAACVLLPSPVLEFPARRGLSLAGGQTLSPELAALTFGLILFHGAYIAEVARAAVLALPTGQIEASYALGLGRWQTIYCVAAPYVRRLAIPPLTNQYLALIKNCSLAVAIGYPDLIAVINTVINQTGQAIEAGAIAVGAYLLLSVAVASASDWYDARSKIWGFTGDLTERLGERLSRLPPRPGSLQQRLIQAALGLVAALLIFRVIDWAIVDAVWTGSAQACSGATGACWAVIHDKWNLLIFGTLPASARPRAVVAMVLIILGLLLMLAPRISALWRPWLSVPPIMAAPLILHGTVVGQPPAPIATWGGLAVTILLAVYSILFAAMLALPLAVARKSSSALLRAPATAVIETVRGVPLVLLLFVTVSVLPLVLGGLEIGKVFLVLAALTLHAAANLAETWRAALSAVLPGQVEGARSLGLSRWLGFRLVVWPQAFRISLPPTVGTVIGAVKDTSLVLVIGVFDLLSAAKAAIADTTWHPYTFEVYVFVAAFYFTVCFGLSLYAEHLRTRPSQSR